MFFQGRPVAHYPFQSGEHLKRSCLLTRPSSRYLGITLRHVDCDVISYIVAQKNLEFALTSRLGKMRERKKETRRKRIRERESVRGQKERKGKKENETERIAENRLSLSV